MSDQNQPTTPGSPQTEEPEYAQEPLPRTMPRLKVRVEQKHIDYAMPRTSHACMIADAIKEQYPHFTRIEVDIGGVYFTDTKRDRRYWYFLHRTAQEALIAWEYRIPPDPFDFWLSRGQVARSGRKPGVKQRPGDRAKRAIPSAGSSLGSLITPELPPKMQPDIMGTPTPRSPGVITDRAKQRRKRGKPPKHQRVFGMRVLTSSTLDKGSMLARRIAKEMGLPVEPLNNDRQTTENT